MPESTTWLPRSRHWLQRSEEGRANAGAGHDQAANDAGRLRAARARSRGGSGRARARARVSVRVRRRRRRRSRRGGRRRRRDGRRGGTVSRRDGARGGLAAAWRQRGVKGGGKMTPGRSPDSRAGDSGRGRSPSRGDGSRDGHAGLAADLRGERNSSVELTALRVSSDPDSRLTGQFSTRHAWVRAERSALEHWHAMSVCAHGPEVWASATKVCVGRCAQWAISTQKGDWALTSRASSAKQPTAQLGGVWRLAANACRGRSAIGPSACERLREGRGESGG